MALPLIELLLVLSMLLPLLLPLFGALDLADLVSEVLEDVLVLDLALVPDVLLSEEADLLLLDLADGELLEEERELLPVLPWFEELMSELPIPDLLVPELLMPEFSEDEDMLLDCPED